MNVICSKMQNIFLTISRVGQYFDVIICHYMSKDETKRKFESFGFPSGPSQDGLNRRLHLYMENGLQKGNDFQLSMLGWMKLSMLKNLVQKRTGIPLQEFRLLYKGQELTLNSWQLEDYYLRNHSRVRIESRATLRKNYELSELNVLDFEKKEAEIFEKARCKIEAGFTAGIVPKLTDFGTQGTYLLQDVDKRNVAIFKPRDEEAFAPNNPRGYVGKINSQTLRAGILSGESGEREVAAYILDHEGFHSVPLTTIVTICHPSFKVQWEENYKQFDLDKIPMKTGL